MPAAGTQVNCSHCDHPLRDGARFCDSCGQPQVLACIGCGTELRAGARFCDSCGQPTTATLEPAAAAAPEAPERSPRDYTPKHLADRILRSQSAIQGERKQVTVLFADVKGSMELAAQLGDEAWHRILDRFFQLLSDGVHRFEGTVNQYTGDGVMALFGAPIAHEDHAQRACYASVHILEEVSRYATELKREHGLSFSARLGLNSGDVVVGKIGDDLRMDYTAQGQTVGLAQRMETLASPDTCYLSAATARLVSGYLDLEDLGEFNVKGLDEPVAVHRLIGMGSATSRFDISRARGLTRFIGRDADMATLETALEQAQAGNGQVVGIVAEAGTGKSRLCFEFAERCRARGLVVNQGTGVAHGKNLPYLPILQVFRGYYGIQEGDDDRTIREKIAGRMLLLDEDFRDELPVLFEFFGAPDPERPLARMDPDAMQRQLFSVLRRIVQGADPRAGAQSFITLIEDLHWLDPGSETFLEQWVEAVAGSSAFLLLNFRPEYRAGWSQRSYYHQIPLAPLGPDAIRDLLDDLLGSDPSTEGLAETIHARTGGNPFFTEEVVQTLIESGQLEGERGAYRLVTPVESLEVPPSVKAVLAARIDRLSERQKQVLQTASVVGKEFAEPILREAIELPDTDLREALAALKAAEFVYEAALYPVEEFAFKHPLTQEVALGSQLAERRQRTHAAVARAIENAPDQKLDEVASLLAHHWEEAGEALPAPRWHTRAAAWVGRNDPVQAVRHLQRVLALTEALEEGDERNRLRLGACAGLLGEGGWRVGLSGDEAEGLFAEGRGLADRAGDAEAAIGLCIGYGATLGFRGDTRRYHELAREAVSLVDDSTSPGPAGCAHGPGFGYASLCLGLLPLALEHQTRSLELSRGDSEVGVETLGFSVWGQSPQVLAEVLAMMGRLDEARAYLAEGTEVCQRHEMWEELSWTLNTSIVAADLSGVAPQSAAADEALRQGIQSVESADRTGSPFGRSHAYRGLGTAHLLQGSWDEACASLDESLRIAREGSGLEREAQLLALLARAGLGAGDATRALERADEAIARAEAMGTLWFGAEARIARAAALRMLGTATPDEIEAELAVAEREIDETEGRGLEPRLIEERARLHAMQGDADTAHRGLERARDRYAAIGAHGHAARLNEELV
jgi:class 3 adenylate cyclase/tetratricopeptide (TPR) repeat protein